MAILDQIDLKYQKIIYTLFLQSTIGTYFQIIKKLFGVMNQLFGAIFSFCFFEQLQRINTRDSQCFIFIPSTTNTYLLQQYTSRTQISLTVFLIHEYHYQT